MELTERLKALAKHVIPGEPAADIGTDHAKLPIYLVSMNICPKVIATDLNEMPLNHAQSEIRKYGLLGKIELRLGDGLSPLKPGEVKSVVIAGMGGNTIARIIEGRPEIAREVRLILQPMADSYALRLKLVSRGYRIIAEEIVEEKSRLYEVVVAEAGQMEDLNNVEIGLGPVLLKSRDELTKKYLAGQKEKYRKILINLQKAQMKDLEKAKEISEILNYLEEVLKSWPIRRK